MNKEIDEVLEDYSINLNEVFQEFGEYSDHYKNNAADVLTEILRGQGYNISAIPTWIQRL